MLQLHVDNAVQVRLIWTKAANAGVAVNVLGAVKGSTTINQALADSLGSAIKSALTSSGLAAVLHPGKALTKVGVRDISTVANLEFLDSGGSVVGTGTGDPLPPSTALVVTLRTNKAGRSFRGRVYLGGFTEADNDADGHANSATQTAAVNFLESVQTAMNSAGIPLAILSRNREQKLTTVVTTHSDGSQSTATHLQSSSAGTITPVLTSGGVQLRDAVWDSQRRRGRP